MVRRCFGLSAVAVLIICGSASAQISTFNIPLNSSYVIACPAGKLRGPVQDAKSVAYFCDPDAPGPGPGPGPGPEPTECPPPTFPLVNERGYPIQSLAQVPELFTVQKEYQIRANKSTTWTFNSRRFSQAQGVTSVAPHFAGGQVQSHMTTHVVSKCPGVFNLGELDRLCWGSGEINNVKLSTRGGSGVCKLDPETDYYVSISPWQPVTGEPACGQCGIVHYVKDGESQ